MQSKLDIFAHRGASGYAPENTIAAVRAAAEMGCEWVELDVKLTADNVPIIFHDSTLERTTNGSGDIQSLTYDEIKALDAGSWYGESFFNETIPTLEEMLDVLIECNLGLNLEIKPCEGRDKETAEIVLDQLSRIWDDHDRIIISSFSEVCLEVAKEMTRDWQRALIIDDIPENWVETAEYLDVQALHINGNHEALEREILEDMMDQEYAIRAYTINDPQTAKILLSYGVDGIFTDTPDVMIEEFRTTH